jgi:2-oxoglutarate ferredoxin oxidoreductase subunit gamma
MLIKSFFSGFGGQGVLSMGLILAHSAMREGKHVTYLPVYGAEVRGGTAHCTVAISEEEIASPVASEPEYLVTMNQPSVNKYQNSISSGGTMFINTTLVSEYPSRGDIEIIEIPATALAEELKNIGSTNLVMLGAFIKSTGLVDLKTVETSLEEFFANKKKLVPGALLALRRGFDYVKGREK